MLTGVHLSRCPLIGHRPLAVPADQARLCTCAELLCRQGSLLATSQLQGLARLMEGAMGGSGAKAADQARSTLEPKAAGVELAGAIERLGRLVAIVRGVQLQLPGLTGELDRVLAHAAATMAWRQLTPAPASCLATGDSSMFGV